jgi:Ca2+-binding RTX toxin-like protein
VIGRVARTVLAAGAALTVFATNANAAVNFEPARSFTATAPNSLAIGDFNGDGLRDVAASSSSPNSVKILLGTGSGNFTDGPVVNVPDAEALTAVAAGDLNRDGRDDLALARSGGIDRVEPYIWNGNGFTFTPGTEQPVADEPQDVILAHLNADDLLDAAVATAGAGNSVSIRLGTSGAFAPGSEVPTNGAGDARSVVAGDFTGDGVADLGIAVSNGAAPGAQIAVGSGTGTFDLPGAPVVAAGAVVVSRVDVNRDGLSDVAAGTNTGDVAVVRSTGGGSFASPSTVLNSDGSVSGIAAADLDGDTLDDLVATYVGGTNANRALVFIGRGNDGFDAPQPEAVGTSPSDVGISDFNRDSNLDLVTGNAGSNNVTLLQAIPPTATVGTPDGFGNQAPDVESAPRTVTVRNNGAPRLRPGVVTLSGTNADQFRIVSNGCTGANLAIGQECGVAVAFRPTGLGARSAAVVINSNAAGAPHVVTLSGTGANPVIGPRAGTCVNLQNGTGNAETLTGTDEGDNLFGFAGSDVLNGLGGNDCLTGGEGNDRLNGGEGRDTLEGNNGNDVEDGGNGNDKLSGGAGRDRMSGGAGNDAANGGSGNDTLSGGSGNDNLNGSTGNDRINGGSGKNKYTGGTGNDTITAANGRVEVVDCGTGRDSVRADRKDRVKRCERVRRTRR